MTQRLYYDDAYRTEFEARVVSVETATGSAASASAGQWSVVLDRTAFYPTGGGQSCDRGQLGGLSVVDVLDAGDQVVHRVQGAHPPEVGESVRCRIDAVRRHHHRQQHTGQHVLSRVVEDLLGLPTVSARLGETDNTLDVPTDALDEETLDRVEDAVHRVLWEARAVRVHFVSVAEAAAWGVRQKKERSGPVRVIEVEGLDRCACGGTHVANTAEVGMLAILGCERVRGGLRVHFLCGDRALRWRREHARELDRVARCLTTAPAQVVPTVERMMADAKEAQKRLATLTSELVSIRSRDWTAQARPLRDGTRLLLRRLQADEVAAAATVLRALTRDPSLLVALIAEEEGKGQILIGKGGAVPVDCEGLLRDVLEELGGRGGGRADQARGGFPAGRATEVEGRLLRRLGLTEAGCVDPEEDSEGAT